MSAEKEKLSGHVERVVFHNDGTGFSVLRVRVEGRSVATVVGTVPQVSAGESIEACGTWVMNRTHGREFKADTLQVVVPTTTTGIRKYLGSGLVKGIGPHFADKLIDAFGERVFDVIDNEPERLREIRGIGAERQQRILEAWQQQRSVREIMVFLHSYGVSTGRAIRIYKTYGRDAVGILRSTPYRLASDIHGIGFTTADGIARRLGIPRDSPARALAGLLYVLQKLTTEGHCAFPAADLLSRAGEMLELETAVVEAALEHASKNGDVCIDRIGGELLVYPVTLHRAEVSVAKDLAHRASGEHPLGTVDTEKALQWVKRRVGVMLAPSQTRALAVAMREKVVVITGGPGVGKTTLIRSLLAVFQVKGLQCVLCAPTGRAARRLSETTGGEAKTVHRLLDYAPGTRSFRFHRERQLRCDALIIDEASMVDVQLMHNLVQALPERAALVIVGDADQLPSVGPGHLLYDIIRSEVIAVVRLTEIFRQAADSHIVSNAHRIHGGQMPIVDHAPEPLADFYFIEADDPEEVVRLMRMVVKERIPKRFGLDPVKEVQVLTPMKRSRLGTQSLNTELQALLNPPPRAEVKRFGWTYRVNDKVMQTQNNYNKEVFNGDIGWITAVDPIEGQLVVRFDTRELIYEFGELDELAPAYACSVHKSQGSEYPAVVLPIHTQHYILLHRHVLYTAVTRAKKLVVLIGSRRALRLAGGRVDSTERFTALEERLRGAAGRTRPANA